METELSTKRFKSDFLRKPADLVLGFYEIGSWPAPRVQFFQTLF